MQCTIKLGRAGVPSAQRSKQFVLRRELEPASQFFQIDVVEIETVQLTLQ